jgi:hypothetical protein
MFNPDLIQVAILWSIAGLSLICAMNSRGPARAVASGLIAVAIIATAVIFSYIKYDHVKRQIGIGENISASSSSPAEKNNAVKDFTATACSPAEKHLLDEAIAISDSILTFPKWKDINEQGIEMREIFESKALSLRNKSMDTYRHVRNLYESGAENLCYYDLLLAAADNLRLAGYETHGLFGREHDYINDSMNKAAIRAAQARAVFLQLKEEL